MRRAKPHQPLDQFGAARPDHAADAEHLTRADLEGNLLRAMVDGKIRDGQDRCGCRLRSLVRIKHIEFAADHQFGHFALAEPRRRPGADHPAIAQDRDAVGQRLHFVEAVRDIENGDAVIAQAAHDVEQRRYLVIGQHGRRLIEDHHLSLVQQRACDLHELALGERQVANAVARPGRRAHPRQQFGGAAVHRPVVHHEPAADLAAEKQIFGNRQVARQQDFLMHQHDAGGLRLHGIAKRDRPAFHREAAGARRDITGQELHQRGLASAILADHRMNLARQDVERDVRQYRDLAVGLAEPFGAECGGQGACRRLDRLWRDDRVHSKADSRRSRERSIWRRIAS